MHLTVPGEAFRQHHDPVLGAIMLADQYGARLEPEPIAELEIGRLVPGSILFPDPIKEALHTK